MNKKIERKIEDDICGENVTRETAYTILTLQETWRRRPHWLKQMYTEGRINRADIQESAIFGKEVAGLGANAEKQLLEPRKM